MARTLKEIIATEKPEVVEKAKAMASEMLLRSEDLIISAS